MSAVDPPARKTPAMLHDEIRCNDPLGHPREVALLYPSHCICTDCAAETLKLRRPHEWCRAPHAKRQNRVEDASESARTLSPAVFAIRASHRPIGDEYRALPWSVLHYNEQLDAYELNVTEDQLRNAPVLAGGWDTGGIDRDWERNIHNYYHASPYW
jgi:hypothetical protein